MKTKGAAAAAVLVIAVIVWMKCSKGPGGPTEAQDPSAPSGSVGPSASARAGAAAVTGPFGLSAPIAAVHVAGGAVVVAALDVAAKAIRVRRIDAKDEVVTDRVALADVAWSTDSDLKIAAAADGVAVTWRGLRAGKLVRQLSILSADLGLKGAIADVSASSCATRDALWSSDGSHAIARPWAGANLKVSLPKEKEASLLCGAHRAFALLEEDERISLLGLFDAGAPVTMIRESEFGEDDQRELSEYTIGDDVGVVRLAASGAIAMRELSGTTAGPLHKLKTKIGKDDDIVAVDASPRVVVIVYTEDVAENTEGGARGGESATTVTCTKVSALRVDRQSHEESSVELAPAKCGREVGPFFTNALGDAVSVAWPERMGTAGRARAPIVGLVHTVVAGTGVPAVARIDQPADALVDAGCDGTTCYAVALVRPEGTDGMIPGAAKVLRYR